MQLGLIGLGKMGGNMRERIRRAGHEVVGYDRNPEVSDVRTLAALVKKLDAPRVVWVMVPHGDPTRETVAKLGDLLDKSLRRGLVLSDGDLTPFFMRPICAVLALVVGATLLLGIPSVKAAARRRWAGLLRRAPRGGGRAA